MLNKIVKNFACAKGHQAKTYSGAMGAGTTLLTGGRVFKKAKILDKSSSLRFLVALYLTNSLINTG